MSIKQETNNNNSEESHLDYIQIDHKNKIEELSTDEHIIVVSNLLKSFSLMEDNIGGEINKVFQSILPESKETDPFKLIISISAKSKIDNDHLENCLNEVMNRPERDNVTLTKDLSEQLSTIIKEIFKKIKKHSKIKNFDQLIEETKKYLDDYNQDDILKKYKLLKPVIMFNNYNNDINNFGFSSEKNIRYLNINNYEYNSSGSLIRVRKKANNNIMKSQERASINGAYYKFKKFKEDSKYSLPVELLILMRKFNMIKKLRLIISNNNGDENILNYEEGGENNINNNSSSSLEMILDQNDLQNYIFVLLNIKWLFYNIVELEVDFSSDSLTESEINLYKYSLGKFAKLVHKEIKITTYTVNSYSKRNYDPIQKSLFSQGNNHIFEDDHSSDVFSSSMTSNNLNYNISFNQTNIINNNNNSFTVIEEKGKSLENFIKKYKALLEMMFVYGYFIRKMEKIIKTKFILPLNLSNEIFEMLKKQKIMVNNFHFLSFVKISDIIHSTIDFNSLDNQTFEKVLCFLNQNQLIDVCNLSFFPPEEYFKTELLFKILQNNDENYKLKKNNKDNKYIFNQNIINDLRSDEDLDVYFLRKLSKDFEKNLKSFFYLLTIKTCISELSLIFDLPTILIKNGYYNNILMKFFLNIFIFIDNSLNNIKTLSINAENFIFDSRKNPIINNFFDKLSFYLKPDNKLTSLTFQVRFYNISKIYRLIPYNLTYLSLGSFDYETFNCFVDYLTSREFSKNAHLNKLKINLNNSVIEINKIYDNIVKLFTEYPKELTEISIFSFLTISYYFLMNILMKTNYNTLGDIFFQFNKKSIIMDNNLEKKLEYDISNLDMDICIKNDNFLYLYKIKRNKKLTNKLINVMMNLNKKNNNIMKNNIYINIEKFLCANEKKKVILQFK